MAKGGKLTKLKSVLKKMQSFKLSRSATNANSSAVAAAGNSSSDDESNNNFDLKDLRPVYVGKSRRRYLVRSDVIDHPLVRELVVDYGDSEGDSVAVGCEVVLFEHLLWMLENADPQPESLDELVDFYSC